MKAVPIKEYIEKINDVKEWEDRLVATKDERRLPNYIILNDGTRVTRKDWLDSLKRFQEWTAKNNKLPNFVYVNPMKSADSSSKKVFYYPTVRFIQDVGSGAFGDKWYPNKAKRHAGVDVDREKIGLAVRSVGEGVVKHYSNNYRWDSVLCIEHPEHFCSTYWHLEKVPSRLRPGAKVKAGEQIGVIGRVDSHQWTGPAHLHFGIYNSTYTATAIKGALEPKLFPTRFVEPYGFLKNLGAIK